LPRDVFLTFAVFFAAFGVVASGLPAASALSFCFLVAMSGVTLSAGRRRGVNDHDRANCHSVAHALPICALSIVLDGVGCCD
jgi:hypothetical protein